MKEEHDATPCANCLEICENGKVGDGATDLISPTTTLASPAYERMRKHCKPRLFFRHGRLQIIFCQGGR